MPAFKGINPLGLESQHHLRFTTQESLLAYTLTGVVPIKFQGTGPAFTRDTLTFSVPVPELPAGKGLLPVDWTCYVGLNSISNDSTAINAAWAVDAFRIQPPKVALTAVIVEADLAVRDSDGFILRVGYVVQLVGSLADLPAPPK